MRIQDVEEGFGQLRQLIVELPVNPGGQEGEAFQQAFDVRILAAIRLQSEPLSDLPMFLGKLRAHLAQKAQLPLVIADQLIRHRLLP